MLATRVVILILAGLYWFPLRRWFARWGAMPEDIDQSERRIVLVGYRFGLAAAWWTVVAVIAAVTRGQVAHQPIQTRTA